MSVVQRQDGGDAELHHVSADTSDVQHAAGKTHQDGVVGRMAQVTCGMRAWDSEELAEDVHVELDERAREEMDAVEGRC